jgi:hypothetical protein
MKKLLLFLILFVLAISSYGQVHKYTAQHSTIRFYNKTIQDWDPWDQWKESNILVVINITHNVIDVYSARNQSYSIVQYGEKEYFDDRESVSLFCIDEEGIKCNVDLVKYNNGESHLYVRWRDMQLGYNITPN